MQDEFWSKMRAISTFGESLTPEMHGASTPIERLMAAALRAKIIESDLHILPGWILEGRAPAKPHELGFTVVSQFVVGPYTADFVVFRTGFAVTIAVAVECDGHEFHDRTKSQAVHDRRRDRYFQEQGYQIARFTGSEIWANAPACAKQVMEMLEQAEFRYYDAQVAATQKEPTQ